MENFTEKFAELKKFVDEMGFTDFMECVDYLDKVLIPHCKRMEEKWGEVESMVMEIDGELETDYELFQLGKLPKPEGETIIT
jgi:hypothetical protein